MRALRRPAVPTGTSRSLAICCASPRTAATAIAWRGYSITPSWAQSRSERRHGFYYSDYNNDGSKFYHPDKWTCCTGTFAQITADYGISSYFRRSRGIYINLYVPSRVTWSRGREVIAFTQQTNYPHHPTSRISIDAAIPSRFPDLSAHSRLGRTEDHDRSQREAGSYQPHARPVCRH